MSKTVEILARNIASRLDELGFTKRNISIKATGKEDAIREIERGKMPSAERLAAIATALMTTPENLFAEDVPARLKSEVIVGEPIRPFSAGGGQMRDLPIYGTALGHSLKFDGDGTLEFEQTVLEPTDAIKYIKRPDVLIGVKGAYAVYIQGDSMAPRWEPGDLAVVDPRKPPNIGDDVIVQLVGNRDDEHNGEVVCVLIKRLVRRSPSYVELLQYQPETTFRVDSHKVHEMHRIVRMGELLGD